MTGGVLLYEDENREGAWHVDGQAYQTVLQDVINGENPLNQETISLTNPADPDDRPLKVRTGEVAEYFGLYEKARMDAPSLVQTKHGLEGTTHYEENGTWRNPGVWNVIAIKDVDSDDVGDYHHMPYRIYEVEPADLHEEGI
jgi:hypothetical protein